MTKDEENVEVLNALFASVFDSKTHCSLATQPSELEGRDRQPHNPRGKVKQPATPLRHTEVYEARWYPPKGTERVVSSAHQDTFHHLSSILPKWRGPN